MEFEQGGSDSSEYGEKLISRLSTDLIGRHGRGFSKRNVEQMRAFYHWLGECADIVCGLNDPRIMPDAVWRILREPGAGFTFVARQKRIRIGDEWYRMELLPYRS